MLGMETIILLSYEILSKYRYMTGEKVNVFEGLNLSIPTYASCYIIPRWMWDPKYFI
jgi:hypothetical protein